MKLPNMLFRFALITAIGSQPYIICAAEVRSGGRGEGDRDASAPLLPRTLQKVRGQSMTADRSDRLQQNHITEWGESSAKPNNEPRQSQFLSAIPNFMNDLSLNVRGLAYDRGILAPSGLDAPTSAAAGRVRRT
ncbi:MULTISPECIES: hypothetical protein [Pseudomonas]|uniref:hypothetical protein n=1 Tax=Pseudomonas TaxID=286 RepID=UPI002118B4E7|nr:hypothetical protein [Pseudomonas siliginis]